MCCGGQCLFFIPVRTGSMIFGYLIAVISALGTLACTGAILYFGIVLMFQHEFYDWTKNQAVPAVIITTGYLVEFLSSFVCTVLLLVGITKNKPALVKTFLIYGMIQVVLLLVFFIILHCATSFFLAGFFFLAMAFVGLYVMCLYMVFKAYQSMSEGQVFVNPPVNTGLLN